MSGGIISDESVKEALQRAKELAADTTSNTTLKRSLPDDIDQQPAKRANLQTMDGSGLVQMGGAYMQIGNPNESILEVISVPESTVGLIIGRNGTEIQAIQNSSGCRVQMSPENESEPGSGVRQCTLQGSKASIERAKQLINDVIMRANHRQAQGGLQAFPPTGNDSRHITSEILIPPAKCGLVIGKQGDTIKQLQEQAGCRMVMIQDSQEVTGQAKPLRITGDPDKVELAKRLVTDLLNSRDDAPGGGSGGSGGMHRPYASHDPSSHGPTAKGEVVVPRASVGMIIGKGGETIKRLAMETGTKIQFKPDADPNSADRCAMVMGTREQIYKATELITELVHKSLAGGQGGTTETFYMHVPSNKTGLVIGKGGETIKQINAESGAHCELSRDPPPNPQEKVFIIKGTPFQIHHAQHIIRIKVGDVPPGTPVPPFNGVGPQMGNGASFASPQFGGQFVPQNQWSTNFGQPDHSGGNWGQQAAQPYYANAPAGAYGAPQYQQPGSQPYVAPAAQAAAVQPTAASAPAINPQTGQPDYSAQWAEYYRNMGMHEQAAIIESQMKQNQAARQPGAAPQAGSATVPGAAAAAGSGFPPGAQTQAFPAGGAVPAGAAAAPTTVPSSQYPGFAGAQPQQFAQSGQFAAQPQQF